MKKTRSIFLIPFTAIVAICILSTCKYDKATPDFNNYPADIGKIIFTKCATPGCHNDASKGAAAGLSLSSWDKLFEGGDGSACVIPYRSDYSTLFYFTNTFPDLGVTLVPTMPYNKEHLTREEVTLLKKWIDAGAPNRDGFVKFSDNPNRKKFYVTTQGCQEVVVFDMETLLPMRYINVGDAGVKEYAHNIKISPDGKYWYVLSSYGSFLKKYRTSDDGFVGQATLGNKYWQTITISNNGKRAYITDWDANGDVPEVDLNTMLVLFPNISALFNPHGSCFNSTGDTLYITGQNNSQLYKVPINDTVTPYNDFSNYPPIKINLYPPASPPPSPLNSHEVLFSPDGTKYFVTCQSTTNPEVRIFQAGTDKLLAAIPVGTAPSEMAVSAKHNYLFVTCEGDITSFPGKTGSVAVIDISNNTLKSVIYPGHQPHGIGVDDTKNMVFVANRNQTAGGLPPHHPGSCGGRNGYITFIDMNTLELVPYGGDVKKVEVSVDPYSIAVRY